MNLSQTEPVAQARYLLDAVQIQQLDHGLRSNDSVFSALPAGDTAHGPGEAASDGWGSEVSRVSAEALNFTVGAVQSEPELAAVQALRACAYEHHLPGMGSTFGGADVMDRRPGSVVFFARDKQSGDVVGSARLLTNRYAPLQIEHSVDLPHERQGQMLAEVTRLVVRPGYVGPVRLGLVKAMHLYCVAMQIRGVLASARTSLLRPYRQLGFAPLFADGQMTTLAHVGGLPHHILLRDTALSETDGRDHGREAYEFMVRTYHPDIKVFDAIAAACVGGALPPTAYPAAA